MNPERFMVKAKNIKTGRYNEGFLAENVPDKGGGYVLLKRSSGMTGRWNIYRIDPDTIEPVERKIVLDPIYDNGEGDTVVGYDALCPDCEEVMDSDMKNDFCHLCGQRLLWPAGDEHG